MYMYKHVHMHTRVHMHTCTHTHVYVHTPVLSYHFVATTWSHVHYIHDVCVCVCVCVCMYGSLLFTYWLSSLLETLVIALSFEGSLTSCTLHLGGCAAVASVV